MRPLGLHFGGVWRPLGKLIESILASFSDIVVAIHPYILGKWILMDFKTVLETQKSVFQMGGIKKIKLSK